MKTFSITYHSPFIYLKHCPRHLNFLDALERRTVFAQFNNEIFLVLGSTFGEDELDHTSDTDNHSRMETWAAGYGKKFGCG